MGSFTLPTYYCGDMKTTAEIADDLAVEVKAYVARESVTLRFGGGAPVAESVVAGRELHCAVFVLWNGGRFDYLLDMIVIIECQSMRLLVVADGRRGDACPADERIRCVGEAAVPLHNECPVLDTGACIDDTIVLYCRIW